MDVRLAQALGTDSRILGLRLRGDPPDEPTGALVAGEIFSPTVDASTRWGVEALDRVRGSFVVLGPAGRGKVFVAADQTGASSVYWRTDNGVLFFASEIRLLLRLLRTRPPVNELAVVHWIANSATPAEQTLYDGVFELPAGELLLLSGDGWERRRYWSVRYREPYANSRQEIVETLWTTLTAAVQMRLENAGTAGILMSGGVDSSAVSAAAVEVSQPGRKPRGYSAVFPGHAHPRVDESERIEALVTGIGLPSTQVEVRPGGAFALSLEWLRDVGLPLTGAGFLLERPLLELASRDGVEAVLDGQGGDEAFALSGYLLADRLMRGRLRSSLGLTRRLPGGDRQSRRRLYEAWRYYALRGALPTALHERLRRARDPYRYAPDFLRPDIARLCVATDGFWAWKRAYGEAPLWWRHKAFLLTTLRQHIQLGEYLRHRAAMFGMRARPPLFDVDLLEFVLRIPPELEFDPQLDRPLIREAMAGRVPDSVRLSVRKSNLAPFYYDSIAGPDMPAIRGVLDADRLEIGAYVQPEVVRRLVTNPPAANAPNWLAWMSHVWRLVTAESWLRFQSDPSALQEQESSLPRPEWTVYRTHGLQASAARREA